MGRCSKPLLLFVTAALVGVAAGCAGQVAAPGCKTKNGCVDSDVVVEPLRLFVDPPFGLGYDCVTIGCDNERRLVVENRGGGTIKLALVRLSIVTSQDFVLRSGDGNELPFNADTSVAVTADTPLELFVRYAPTDGVDDEGSVSIDWYDGELAFEDAVLTRVELPLSTRALGDVVASLQGGRLNFGFVPVGGYASRDIVVKNDGNGGVLSAGPVTLAEGTSTAFFEPTAGAWATQFVNPGAESRIAVHFRPDVEGVFTGSLFVQSNDGAHPALEVAVAGTALADPRAELSALSATSTLDFQTIRVGASRTVEFLVHNDGGAPLTVQATAAGAGFAVYPPEPQTIAPLEAAAFAAVWSPVVGGAFSGRVVLTTNDPTQTRINIDATGFADAPALSAAPVTVDFGGVVQGWTTGAQAFLISNNGSGDLTINTIAFDVGSSSQIRFAEVPPLPVKLVAGDPPISVSVFLEASTLGTTNAVVLVGSDSIDTGFGSGGIARLNVVGRVITCEEGCPVNNGTPSCGTGACEIGACDNRFHDADFGFGNGCECGEDLVPAGGGARRDIDGQCPGLSLGTLNDSDNPNSTSFTGTLSSENDVDLFSFRANDQSQFLTDDYGALVELVSGPAGLVMFARFADAGVGCGGETQRNGPSNRLGGRGKNLNDNSEDVTVWIEWAPGASPQCGNYTVRFRADNG